MGSGLDSPVNDFLHVWSNQVPLTEYSYARAVSFQNLAMLYQLLKLHLRKLHQAVDLVFRSIKVLDAKGIDRDDPHTTLVAYLQYLGPVSACYAEQSDNHLPWQELQILGRALRWSRSCGFLQNVGFRP